MATLVAAGFLCVILRTGPAEAQQVLPCGQEGSDPADFAQVSRPGPYEPMAPEIVELKSRVDGFSIQIGIVRPRVPAGEDVPVIVDASPYFHALGSMDWTRCPSVARLVHNYVSHGYAVAAVPVRGTGDSGGCMNLMGPNERADLDQAITWLGTQDWSNRSVAMIGKSYDGSTPWMVAAAGNPHLKTIVPASGVPDLFTLLYGAGTPDWRGPLILSDIYFAESIFFYAPGREPQHTVEVAACPEYAAANAAAAYSSTTGLMDPSGYWEARRYTEKIERNYDGSVFLIQGLQDWNVNPGQQFPWIKRLEDRGAYVKYLLGQWGHSWPDEVSRPHLRPDYADILLNWFDRWLKRDKGAPLGPRVQVEDSSGRWRNSRDWPPRNATETRLALASDGRLSEQPSNARGSQIVGPDPTHTQAGGLYDDMPPGSLETTCVPGTCALFETNRLERPLRIAGLPELDLRLVPYGPGGGLAAYLYAVSEEGATRLGWGQVNLAFEGPGKPRPVTPGRPMRVRFEMQPLDAVATAGSKLALVVGQGSAWNRLPTIAPFPVELLVGGNRSSLTFLQPSPKPGDFFRPPKPGS